MMPRTARKKSSSGIYHIIMRGINRQSIFEDEEDNRKFLQTLKVYKEICGFSLFAYCLMINHVHLLLKEGLEPLDKVMRRLCSSYVYWYNRKYERIGNLFQDRYKSEPVDDDAYFVTVLRYIHRNPIQAGIVTEVGQYRWSSYHEYLKPGAIVDVEFALKLFDSDLEKAKERWIVYQNETKNDRCLELEERKQRTDQDAREIIIRVCGIKNAPDLQAMERKRRNACLRKLKEYNLSARQIARLTGIGRGVILKA